MGKKRKTTDANSAQNGDTKVEPSPLPATLKSDAMEPVNKKVNSKLYTLHTVTQYSTLSVSLCQTQCH